LGAEVKGSEKKKHQCALYEIWVWPADNSVVDGNITVVFVHKMNHSNRTKYAQAKTLNVTELIVGHIGKPAYEMFGLTRQ
jgi:hypothetical protein